MIDWDLVLYGIAITVLSCIGAALGTLFGMATWDRKKP